LDADFGAVRRPAAHCPSTAGRNRILVGWILAIGGWMLLTPAFIVTAQSSNEPPAAGSSHSTKTSTANHPVHHAVHHHHRAKPAAATAAAVTAAPTPPAPPAEQPANPATIEFNKGLLSIRAENSSLVSTLLQIQHQTGLVIDGLNHDQRIYGQYGPGSISATLSTLLNGSGYDFVIVGSGSGKAAPRLILSAPGGTGAVAPSPPVASNRAAPREEGNPAEPQPEGNPDAVQQDGNPDAVQPDGDQADPTAPPQAKSPQEMFDEMRRAHPQ
jgi:hypothetical protein